MKLHLPRILSVALMAAMSVGSVSLADEAMDGKWKNEGGKGLIYYVAKTDSRAVDATGTDIEGTDIGNTYKIWSDETVTTTNDITFTSLTMKNGDTGTIEVSGWSSNKWFKHLIISDIKVKDAGSAILNIGEGQTVTIGNVSSGKISSTIDGSLSVTGTANFGSVTFGGTTITNTGTITISDALSVSSVSKAEHVGTFTEGDGNGYFSGSYVLVEGGSVSVAQSILDADAKLNWDEDTQKLTYSTGGKGTIYYLSTKEATYDGSASWASTTGFNIGAQGVLKLNTNLANTMTDEITISKSGAKIEINNGVTLSLSKVAALEGQQADYVVNNGGELQIGNGTRTDIKSITVNGDGVLHFDGAASSIGTADDRVDVVLNDNATLQLRNGNPSSAPIYADFTINAGEGGVNMLGSWYGDNTNLAGTLTGKGTLNLGQESGKTNKWTISGVIRDKSATETLSISSNTGVTFSGANTYSGGTTITGNTLVASNASALGKGLVTMKGGKLQLNQNLTVDSIKVENKDSVINLNTKKLTVSNNVTAGDAAHIMHVSGDTNSTLTFNGNLELISNLNVDENADVTLELNGAENKVRVFDFNGKATVKLAADSVLETSNAKDTGSMINTGAQTLWMSVDSSIQLGSKAQFKSHGALVTGKGEGSAISLDGTEKSNVSIWSGGKYENVDIEAKTIYNDNSNVTSWLVDSTLKNSTGSAITANNKGNTLTAVDAATGSINLQNVVQHNLTSLSIGETLVVGAHVGTQEISSTEGEAKITVSGTATFGSGATLNADLELLSGASLTLNGALAMGSTLTLNSGIRLDSKTLSSITSMAVGATVTLFKGVDALTLSGNSFTTLSDADAYTLDKVFTGDDLVNYYLGYKDGEVYAGKVVVAPTPGIPEPATATLSLLALCGLAARRRRK